MLLHRASRPMSLIVIVVLLASLIAVPLRAEMADVEPQVGVTITYNLYATDGYIKLADGLDLYVYGFVGGRAGVPLNYQKSSKAAVGPGTVVNVPLGPPAPTGGPITAAEAQFAGNAQVPGPTIYAQYNDTVIINLKNLGTTVATAPNDPHSLHLHGLDVNAANDGVPETSVAAVPANTPDPGAGNVVVYMFTPKKGGTFMYHCHQEADIHVQMGMYGAGVIYNLGDPAYNFGGPGMGKGGNLYGWNYAKDYVMLLTEVDVRQHTSEEFGTGTFNPVDYKPQYWLLNGLSFPNTIHANTATFNWADWILTHPNYDPLISGSVAKGGQKVLVRMINLGFETQPMHMHGYHAKVIGSDMRGWPWGAIRGINGQWGIGLEKNTTLIGSGETYELLIDFGQQSATSTYAPTVETRYDAISGLPVANTLIASPVIPDPFNPGFTYIGGPVVAGVEGGVAGGVPFQTSQFFPYHNHDDYKATNNGVYPGGQFTFLVPTP